jgi:DNA-binding MarR family transcriptional regulator
VSSGSRRVEVADRLHSAAVHLLRRVRRVDEETGLTAARLSALSVLVFGGPVTLGDLARAEQVSAPTMSRLVTGLERDGLARRDANERDARSVLISATEEGARILHEGRARRIAELERLLGGVDEDELGTLEDAVATLEDALSRPPSG